MKIKKFIKNNISFIIAFIVGVLISGSSVYAATVASSSVSYNAPAGSGLSDNVQGALDGLYTKVNTWIDPSYIDFGTLATNTTKKVLASKNGICIKRNNKVSYFKQNNWSVEQTHIQEVFSDISCDVDSEAVICTASDVGCVVLSYGYVICQDTSAESGCQVSSEDSVSCY